MHKRKNSISLSQEKSHIPAELIVHVPYMAALGLIYLDFVISVQACHAHLISMTGLKSLTSIIIRNHQLFIQFHGVEKFNRLLVAVSALDAIVAQVRRYPKGRNLGEVY